MISQNHKYILNSLLFHQLYPQQQVLNYFLTVPWLKKEAKKPLNDFFSYFEFLVSSTKLLGLLFKVSLCFLDLNTKNVCHKSNIKTKHLRNVINFFFKY